MNVIELRAAEGGRDAELLVDLLTDVYRRRAAARG